MSTTDHTGPGIIPYTVLEQIHDDLATWANTPDSEWEIDYASDEGNAALPKTDIDYAAVTIKVTYDGYHGALYGVDDEGHVALWMN